MGKPGSLVWAREWAQSHASVPGAADLAAKLTGLEEEYELMTQQERRHFPELDSLEMYAWAPLPNVRGRPRKPRSAPWGLQAIVLMDGKMNALSAVELADCLALHGFQVRHYEVSAFIRRIALARDIMENIARDIDAQAIPEGAVKSIQASLRATLPATSRTGKEGGSLGIVRHRLAHAHTVEQTAKYLRALRILIACSSQIRESRLDPEMYPLAVEHLARSLLAEISSNPSHISTVSFLP